MAGGTFRLADVKHVTDSISSTHFPLANAAALEAALGGAEATVALGSEQHKAAAVNQIPADFFPIETSADLFTKLSFLRSANGDKPSDLAQGKRLDAVPPTAGSPPPRLAGHNPGRNVPFVRVNPR